MKLLFSLSRRCYDFHRASFGLILVMATSMVFAQNSGKPSLPTSLPSSVHIEADHLEYIESTSVPLTAIAKSPKVILTGNVIISHVESKLWADRVEVSEKPTTASPERIFFAQGKSANLVRFQHRPLPTPGSPTPALVHGQAERITYNPDLQDFLLQGKSELRQFQDHISANSIHYSAMTGKYTAESATPSSISPKSSSRVNIIFYPNSAKPSSTK